MTSLPVFYFFLSILLHPLFRGLWAGVLYCIVHTRATEILKSKSVRSTDDVIDVIRTWVRQSQIVTKTLHFHPKVYQKLIIFSDTVQLQPVVSKRSRDNPKSLATDRCLIQGSINIRCGVLIHLFFQCPKGSLFFIKSLLVYKFQGRQPFRTF